MDFLTRDVFLLLPTRDQSPLIGWYNPPHYQSVSLKKMIVDVGMSIKSSIFRISLWVFISDFTTFQNNPESRSSVVTVPSESEANDNDVGRGSITWLQISTASCEHLSGQYRRFEETIEEEELDAQTTYKREDRRSIWLLTSSLYFDRVVCSFDLRNLPNDDVPHFS